MAAPYRRQASISRDREGALSLQSIGREGLVNIGLQQPGSGDVRPATLTISARLSGQASDEQGRRQPRHLFERRGFACDGCGEILAPELDQRARSQKPRQWACLLDRRVGIRERAIEVGTGQCAIPASRIQQEWQFGIVVMKLDDRIVQQEAAIGSAEVFVQRHRQHHIKRSRRQVRRCPIWAQGLAMRVGAAGRDRAQFVIFNI